jgi:hypothetical protein
VGENDAREFIARLNQMCLKKRSDPEQRTFLGLISIGHSFGAQVLLRATASTLEQQLISLNAPSGYLRQATPTTPMGDKKSALPANPRKADDLEREAERKALGVDGEHVHHVTHRIEPVDSRELPADRNRLRKFDFSGQVPASATPR